MRITTPVGSRVDDDRAAIDKVVSLLDAFAGQGGNSVGVSEIARRADLAKSTAFRILESLGRNGVVERIGSRYRLGSRLETIARPERVEDDSLREALTPFLVELHEMTRRTVHLAVLRRGDVVYLNKLHGIRQHPCPSRVGGRAPSYCTAVGKALLAYQSAAVLDVVSRGMKAWTPNTVRDPENLSRMLERVRAEILASDDEECRLGIKCVAVPVWGRDGNPIAAFSIAGATHGMNDRGHVTALRRVTHAAQRALLH